MALWVDTDSVLFMAGGHTPFSSMRMKRKEVDEVSDDFSDFSLSSPALKIRRLDAELPPIMEEEESESNQEKAIVLFNPHQQITRFPSSDFSVSLSPDLISGIKNQIRRLRSGQAGQSCDEDLSDKTRSGDCMAVVPWTSNSYPHFVQAISANGGDEMDTQQEVQELMEAEATMDIDDGDDGSFQSLGAGLSQWQQQHCMPPNIPPNTNPPISWFRGLTSD